MGLLPPLNNQFVAILFKPHELICCWIEPSASVASFKVKAYQKIALQNLELERLLLFNSTLIKKHIQQFLIKHSLYSPITSFALNGPCVREKLIVSQKKPTFADLSLKNESQWVWDYTFLYNDLQNKPVYYVCALKKTTRYAYQLISIGLQLNLTTLTTERMALFSLYKYAYGDAFRPSQLCIDMTHHNNMIEQFFFPEYGNRFLHGNNLQQKERVSLLPACGLHALKDYQ